MTHKFTILGSTGFIGSHLLKSLLAGGYDCFSPLREDAAVYKHKLGHVIYCVGLTADFRSKPFDTMRAHVGYLSEILEKATFDSFLYLSSTRVYMRASHADEDSLICANVLDPSDLYNLSKLAGESLCLSCGHPSVRVVRLSNVYGNDLRSNNFLSTVIRDALLKGRVKVETSPNSVKDYVYIDDVVRILPKIAASAKLPLYNVASGFNISHDALLKELKKLTECEVDVTPDSPTISFPTISIKRIQQEFGFKPASLLDQLPTLLASYKEHLVKA